MTPEGHRNDTLNDAAYNLGQLVGSYLSEEEARAELLNAARECGLEDEESLGTIESGLSSGMANPRDTEPGEPEQGAWTPADLLTLVEQGLEPLTPTMLPRTDGLCLLYRGRTHSFIGESGSGKSWLAQWAVALGLKQDHPVLYLDYESSPSSVVVRLLLLGCEARHLTHLNYVSPEAAPKGRSLRHSSAPSTRSR